MMCPLRCAALLAQVRQRGLGDPQRAEHVGLDLIACLLLGQFFDEPELAVTGVVHHDVQAPEMVVRLADGGEVCVSIGDVQPNRQQCVAVLVDQIVQRCGVACGGGHFVASLQRGNCPFTAESARRTGDKPNFFVHAGLQHIRRRRIPGMDAKVPSSS
jgi:hypothetical protein